MGDSRQIFDKLTEAVVSGDIGTVAACYSPDVVVVSPDGRFEGRDEAVSVIRQFLDGFPDLEVTVWNKITSGSVVADEWTLTGTNTGPLVTPTGETLPPNGKRVEIRGADVGVVEDDLVTSHRMYWDQLELLTQLGLAGEPQPAGT